MSSKRYLPSSLRCIATSDERSSKTSTPPINLPVRVSSGWVAIEIGTGRPLLRRMIALRPWMRSLELMVFRSGHTVSQRSVLKTLLHTRPRTSLSR